MQNKMSITSRIGWQQCVPALTARAVVHPRTIAKHRANMTTAKLNSAPRRSAATRATPEDAAQQLQDAAGGSGSAVPYTTLAAATALAASSALLVPERLFPLQTVLTRAVGATLWTQAAALWALKGAASSGRLGSDTYKRLNGALVLWGGSIAAATGLHTSGLPRAAWALAALAAAAGATAGAAASGQRALGVPDVPRLAKGLLHVTSAFSGAFALLSAMHLVLGAAVLAGRPPGALAVLGAAAGGPLATAYGSGLAFAGVVLYTLKDAEDRGRGGASTFQLLAKAMALTGACHAAAAHVGGSLPVVVTSALLAAVSAAFVIARGKK